MLKSSNRNPMPRMIGGYFTIYNNRAERLGRFLAKHFMIISGAAILLFFAVSIAWLIFVPMPIDYN